MLSPKKMKYRKMQKGRITGEAQRGNHLAFGQFGLMALEGGAITARQIEAARIAMTRQTKRGGQVWIKLFPDVPVSKKPAEVRMGKGKGNLEEWVNCLKIGTVVYAVLNVNYFQAKFLLKKA